MKTLSQSLSNFLLKKELIYFLSTLPSKSLPVVLFLFNPPIQTSNASFVMPIFCTANLQPPTCWLLIDVSLLVLNVVEIMASIIAMGLVTRMALLKTRPILKERNHGVGGGFNDENIYSWQLASSRPREL